MKFYKDNNKLYVYEECFGSILVYDKNEWDAANIKYDKLINYKEITLKDAAKITGNDPIKEIDKLFHGMSCLDE